MAQRKLKLNVKKLCNDPRYLRMVEMAARQFLSGGCRPFASETQVQTSFGNAWCTGEDHTTLDLREFLDEDTLCEDVGVPHATD